MKIINHHGDRNHRNHAPHREILKCWSEKGEIRKMDSTTSELNTALHLKSMNNIEPLIVQKLEKAGIKSASCISINDDHYSRKGVRSCKKASTLFGVSLICEDQPKSPFTLDNATVSLPK